MKICWIGTSYFSMGELSDSKGVDIDFIWHIAKRHPTHEHLNLSIPGIGMNYVPYRIEYALEEGATHFIIELPNGLRQNFISSMSKNEAHRKYLRIQEYKNGELNGKSVFYENGIKTSEFVLKNGDIVRELNG